MIRALNPKRYRVEHIFDLSEALLRAKIVLAHAIVLHPDGFGSLLSQNVVKEFGQLLFRCTPVVVSSEDRHRGLALELEARFVEEPFEVPAFKRAVYRAVSKTEDRRQRRRRQTPSGARRIGRVILLNPDGNEGALMSAVLENELQATVEVVTSPRAALPHLEQADCIIAPPKSLLSTPVGAQLAQEMARLGIPLVPLPVNADGDPSRAGQLAWEIAPNVRRSLQARERVREAV